MRHESRVREAIQPKKKTSERRHPDEEETETTKLGSEPSNERTAEPLTPYG
jgi:hypothetical protein